MIPAPWAACRAPRHEARRRTLRRVLGAALLALAAAAPAAAQGGGGEEVSATECCLPLLIPVGARALSLGQALVARPGADALFHNPAALAGVTENQFIVHTATTTLDRTNTFTLLFNSALLGSFAFSYHLADGGEQQATDEFDVTTGVLNVYDHVLSATYASPIAVGLQGGVSYKLYQFRQDCRGYCAGQPSFAATTHALDLGVQFRPAGLPALSLGGSLLHLGFPLQVVNKEQASPLPTRLRLGVAYEALHHVATDSSMTLVVSTEVARPWSAEGAETVFSIGAELAWERSLFARAGYARAQGFLGGPAIGLGMRYDRFDIAVARSFVAIPFVEPFQLTFAVRF